MSLCLGFAVLSSLVSLTFASFIFVVICAFSGATHSCLPPPASSAHPSSYQIVTSADSEKHRIYGNCITELF